MSNSRTADKFVVRFPDAMRQKISQLAEKSHRSMNSEIIFRLEQSMLNSTLIDEQNQLIRQLSQALHQNQGLLAVESVRADLAVDDAKSAEQSLLAIKNEGAAA